jgi:serine/threonine-protein kinase
MHTPPSFLSAALAGRYRLERQLGEGGMATIYLAHDERHNRRVAVKLLKPELAATIGLERFHREIQIIARLNHPHILPLLDSGTIEGDHGRPDAAFFVMPFVEGESLRDRLVRAGKLSLAEAIRLTREVAGALDYAHRHGVIHRDIKPENVLLSEGHAVVADFGIARAIDQAAHTTGAITAGLSITQAGQAIGTPTYMAPEQITGDSPVDGRTDLYALACMLFEMLSGQAPWAAASLSAVLTRRLAEPPPRIRTLEPGVPAGVEAALLKAMAREPAKRHDSAGEFAAALEGALAGQGARRTRPPVLIAGAALLGVIVFGLTRLAGVGHADAVSALAIAPGPASADTTVAHLSDGIHVQVAELLRRLPMLRVTAPSVVAQVRAQEPRLTFLELGERLRVGAILTWGMDRFGDSLRVSAELLSVPAGDLRWSLRYAVPYAELSAIQGNVARMIADSLRLQLSGTEVASMTRRPTVSAVAYDLYLRGRRVMILGIPAGVQGGQAMLDSAAGFARDAIALDSGFALARGLLSTVYFVNAVRGWGDFASHADSALRLARSALAMDSSLGDPWINLMSRAIYLDDDWTTARSLASRALQWSGYDAQVLASVAIVVGEVEGRLDSAIALARRSAELEPSVQSLNTMGDLYMRAGRYDSAVAALRRAHALDTTAIGPRRRLAASYERLGRYVESIAMRRTLGPGEEANAGLLDAALRREGAAGYQRERRAQLQREVDSLVAIADRPYSYPADTIPLPLREGRIATIYAQLGEWTRAMDWVLREGQRRPHRFRLYVANPEFAGLRNDPRFLALVQREGLESLFRLSVSGRAR